MKKFRHVATLCGGKKYRRKGSNKLLWYIPIFKTWNFHNGWGRIYEITWLGKIYQTDINSSKTIYDSNSDTNIPGDDTGGYGTVSEDIK